MATAEISKDGSVLTVRITLTFRKRGGRKLAIAPSGSDSWAPPRPRVDNAMVKALARAHRWQRMLEGGDYATVRELAKEENINPSYLSRVLRLTLLSPNLVEAILNGNSFGPCAALLKPFPTCWNQQQESLCVVKSSVRC